MKFSLVKLVSFKFPRVLRTFRTGSGRKGTKALQGFVSAWAWMGRLEVSPSIFLEWSGKLEGRSSPSVPMLSSGELKSLENKSEYLPTTKTYLTAPTGNRIQGLWINVPWVLWPLSYWDTIRTVRNFRVDLMRICQRGNEWNEMNESTLFHEDNVHVAVCTGKSVVVVNLDICSPLGIFNLERLFLVSSIPILKTTSIVCVFFFFKKG